MVGRTSAGSCGGSTACRCCWAPLKKLEGAEVLVLFQDRQDLSRKNPAVLPLYEGGDMELAPLVLPPALEERLIPGLDRPQLLSALQEAGAIRPGQITLGAPGA